MPGSSRKRDVKFQICAHIEYEGIFQRERSLARLHPQSRRKSHGALRKDFTAWFGLRARCVAIKMHLERDTRRDDIARARETFSPEPRVARREIQFIERVVAARGQR